MVKTLAWVTGQLASIHRYLSDLLGSLAFITLFLSVEFAVTIVMNSFAQDPKI